MELGGYNQYSISITLDDKGLMGNKLRHDTGFEDVVGLNITPVLISCLCYIEGGN